MTSAPSIGVERRRIVLRGAVQGVGFRPTVYRLATDLRLAGWVQNSTGGLELEVEGSPENLDRFLCKLKAERPRAAVVLSEEVSQIEAAGFASFQILPSKGDEPKTTSVPPDLAPCQDCLRELEDPSNRRFAYPFTNCTNCGPRYTVLLDIPYDRSKTTMRDFILCAECQREFDSSQDRRFHAQPMACPVCGPRLWTDPEECEGRSAIERAARGLARGKIVALKGVGGFQLLVDARDRSAVLRLRQRKRREEKPFAVLMSSLEMVHQYCNVNACEEEMLCSPAAPIVLLKPKQPSDLAAEVAKSSPYLGVMLPASPLHHLLTMAYPHPVVATSGNLSDEPIAIENGEAQERLKDVADILVLHDRPIARACDDSVTRARLGRPQVLRRARGYAPLPVVTPRDLRAVLAVGGHFKNTVAIAIGRKVFLSQHVGDLDTVEARHSFENAIEDLCRLNQFKPELVACDAHPDYASTCWAIASGLPITQVQHHHAHVAGCAAENGIQGNYLGVAWDGTGWGLDGTIWGGEFFREHNGQLERIAHLRTFRLPGGEEAIRRCWRPAAGLLWEISGADELEQIPGCGVVVPMLDKGINAPLTSSVGRLFDAVAYFNGVGFANHFEGQAAMCLEHAIGDLKTEESYKIETRNGVGDWAPLIQELLADRDKSLGAARIAAKFHNALANWIVTVAQMADVRDVVLSGGVFQNTYLTERTSALLGEHGFRAFTHHQVPANDGGISLGQAVLAG